MTRAGLMDGRAELRARAAGRGRLPACWCSWGEPPRAEMPSQFLLGPGCPTQPGLSGDVPAPVCRAALSHLVCGCLVRRGFVHCVP